MDNGQLGKWEKVLYIVYINYNCSVLEIYKLN